jgi:SAM-dependent methyltransferase
MTSPTEDRAGLSADPRTAFWDSWNREWRFRHDDDPFMARQRGTALAVAQAVGLRDAKILDVGCGTGWLGDALRSCGTVWGTDLSSGALAEGARRYPGVRFIHGEFLEVHLPAPFDFVVSADALPHMSDHDGFFARIAELLRPGGTLLLMTQNPFVWARRSRIRHVPDFLPHSHPDDWPTLASIRRRLVPAFSVESISTFDPGGDLGVLFWVENRYVRGVMRRLLPGGRWQAMLERLRLGRELVIVARRRA